MKLPPDYNAGPVFGTFTVTVADEAAERLEAKSWLEAEHLLGSFKPVGHSFIQIIRAEGAPVALVQWAACAYHLKDRDAALGWRPRKPHRHLLQGRRLDPLGLTDGNTRQRTEFYVPNDRPKKLWIKPLREDARERLCAPELTSEHAAGETTGKGAPLPVALKTLRPLAAILCCLCTGLLCGASNLNAILRAAAKLTQAQRHQLGLRRRTGSRLYTIPT